MISKKRAAAKLLTYLYMDYEYSYTLKYLLSINYILFQVR